MMKWILTLFLFISLSAIAINIKEYNETLLQIKDPDLKKAVIEKMADKIVDGLKEEEIGNTDTVTEEMAATKINVTKEVIPLAPPQIFEYSLGISWYFNTLTIQDTEVNFIGGILSFGVARNFKRHKYRMQVHYLGASLDYIDDGNDRQYSYDLDTQVEFEGFGIGFSYSYFLTPKLGIGIYANATEGKTKARYPNHTNETTNSSISDYGIRFDLKINAWNPYFAIGGTRYQSKSGDNYTGASGYLGLLNFEY